MKPKIDSTLINIYVFHGANIAVLGLFQTLWAITLSKKHAWAQIIACQASRSTRDELHHFEIIRKRDHITAINIYVLKSANIAVLGLFWHPRDHNPELRACTATNHCLPSLTGQKGQTASV